MPETEQQNWFDKVPTSRITDNIFLSGYKPAADLWSANPLGITHVLNVSTNEPYLQAEGISYMDCPFHDGHPIPEDKFAACMAFMQSACESGGKILVHCAAGISRSATTVAAYLHYSKQMELNDALTYIMACRPIVNPAVATLNSARKMLRAWPYDGSMSEVSEDKKLLEDAILQFIINKAKDSHPNSECPVRVMLLRENPGKLGANTPRHTIKCNCSPKSK
jgi:protein-tyrosine phosphatase